MATSLKEMSRLSNGGVVQHVSMCMQPVDYAMAIGGAGLVLYGLVRRTVPGLGVAAMGAALVAYTCCRERDDESDKVRRQVINAPRRYAEQTAGDIDEKRQSPRDSVDEASMESFPGSDAPAHNVVTA